MIEAKGFPAIYGRGLLPGEVEWAGSWLVVTQPEPWAVVGPTLTNPPAEVVWASDLSPAHLDHLVATLPTVDLIVGLGGGSAMDTAKWIHWRRQVPLVQMPSLPSVNACFTRMTALRDIGGVRYEGDAMPERVLVDYDLMAAASPALVRGGIGDVLSCHTARFDWALAVAAGHEPAWDDEAAAMSLVYLDELEALAPALATGADDGVRALMELHRDIGWRCHDLAHARFEEGSEHFFAYAFEEVTGRTIMHGELVAIGVLIMSALQDNRPEWARAVVDAVRMRSGLEELSVTWDEVEASLRYLPGFVTEQRLWYSVANDLVVDSRAVRRAREALRV